MDSVEGPTHGAMGQNKNPEADLQIGSTDFLQCCKTNLNEGRITFQPVPLNKLVHNQQNQS